MAPTAIEKQMDALITVRPGVPAEQARAILRSFVVLIRAPREVKDKDAETRAHLLLNLLPRVFDIVHYDGPESYVDFPDSHKNRIRRDAPPRVDLVINLGPSRKENCRTLYVASRGWVAYLSTETSWDEPVKSQNGIAAAFAAALAVQDAFNYALGAFLERAQSLHGTYRYDVARLRTTNVSNYEPDVSRFHTEDLLLVGVGAVGQAFLVGLAALPHVTGEIRILDHDISDEGNEQRCLLAFPEAREQPKVFLAQQYIRKNHPNLRIDIPFAGGINLVMDYGAYRNVTGGRAPERLVVTTVDHEQPRRDVQAALHHRILNGWTETNNNMLAYGLGWHTMGGSTGCLSCFHKPSQLPPSEAEFAANRTGFPIDECRRRLSDSSILTSQDDIAAVAKRLKVPAERLAPASGRPFVELLHGVCGVAAMDVQGEPVVASVTHVPALVGFLLAGQLVLHSLQAPTTPHLAFFDAFRLPSDEHEDRRAPNPACYCQTPIVQATYRKQWNIEDSKTPRSGPTR